MHNEKIYNYFFLLYNIREVNKGGKGDLHTQRA